MKKKPFIAILVSLFLVAGLYIGYTFLSYEPIEGFGNFPIPKNANLIKSEEDFRAYSWSGASETDGIPLSYKWKLQLEDWKVIDQEGSATVYQKDNTSILLVCQNDYLSIGFESSLVK